MVAKWGVRWLLLLSGLFWVIGLGNYPNRRKKELDNWAQSEKPGLFLKMV